jgi:hypothetical protein
MCKLTKEEDFDLPEAQYLLSLGRRSFEQLLEQNPPAPCPTMPAPSQTETQSSSSGKPSLANEIQSLIKMGKDRNISSVPIESHPLESSNTIGQNSKKSEDLINIKGQPEKRLIIQETSDRFGLINKKNSKGVFHFVKSFDAETSDVQPTLRDIQDKIDLTFNSQQLLLRTLLIQNQQMNCQIEGLKRDFRELRYECV